MLESDTLLHQYEKLLNLPRNTQNFNLLIIFLYDTTRLRLYD